MGRWNARPDIYVAVAVSLMFIVGYHLIYSAEFGLFQLIVGLKNK